MNNRRIAESFIIGTLLCAGCILSAAVLSDGFTRFRSLDRTVTVKGLSEREVEADIALWPVGFDVAADDLAALVGMIREHNAIATDFLLNNGFQRDDISVSAPSVVDHQAQGYGDPGRYRYRYAGNSTVSVYTSDIDRVRQTREKLGDLGARGVAISGENYENRTEYLYTGLNEIKPAMIEEATTEARLVAEKFAADSGSRLGKIKKASQGQFSIADRDSNTPYIKKVRVVSTVEYYLVD
ncbi:MAG: hypothetical protein C1942_00015 [Prosthecochloris sp.]|uniref:SIMPL domain-containing protein n=1 Tax=Prosthecochloris sp. TaxID=290513 RepID=UPI0013CD4C14|nr:SIMPL domain-containing protein [Prosthecochloris sp.]NEX11082.1 hypothetical protein [Prosthecochloris sp.]